MLRWLVHTARRASSSSSSKGKKLPQVSKPPTDDAYNEYGEFLWMVMLRLNNRVLGQVFRALGDSDRATGCFQAHLLDHTLRYTEIVSGDFPPPSEKPLGFDDCGDYPCPYPHMIQLVNIASEDDFRHFRGEPPIHHPTQEETRLVHDFCRSAACRAEKEVFSGEPNMQELQEQARVFAAESYPNLFGLQSTSLTSLIHERSPSYATPVVPHAVFSSDHLKRCARGLRLAQEVADAGGLPQFSQHGGLIALYNFEKKHAQQLLLNCLKHNKGYDKRKLLCSSFENQQFYTVDVQVPGLTSLDQVRVANDGQGVRVSTEKDVFRPENLVVPPHADVNGAIVNLQDEILTIRFPKGAAALKRTASTVPIEDRDEAELDTTTNKRIEATTVDEEHHHTLYIEVPGLSREEVIVVCSGPDQLTVKTSANVFKQRKFKLPTTADLKKTRAFLQNGLLTIHIPKSAIELTSE
ncbi:hypothetical protein SELMODRAFT_413077 [Selaginella moellendorffii]|uniref:SHSP domain-containing protein n=1 Tax=Selaginella moellendorffii TaxID=88036 RepID=D8RN94_SELML|nr:hypothetical protein SELMODRAFT_413077 [Selaginella moellendorffii]